MGPDARQDGISLLRGLGVAGAARRTSQAEQGPGASRRPLQRLLEALLSLCQAVELE